VFSHPTGNGITDDRGEDVLGTAVTARQARRCDTDDARGFVDGCECLLNIRVLVNNSTYFVNRAQHTDAPYSIPPPVLKKYPSDIIIGYIILPKH